MTTVTSTMTAQRTLGHIIQLNKHFFHDFPIKVWGAYYTNVHIIFKFYGNQYINNLTRVLHLRDIVYSPVLCH